MFRHSLLIESAGLSAADETRLGRPGAPLSVTRDTRKGRDARAAPHSLLIESAGLSAADETRLGRRAGLVGWVGCEVRCERVSLRLFSRCFCDRTQPDDEDYSLTW